MSIFKIINKELDSHKIETSNEKDIFYSMLKIFCLFFKFPMAALYIFNEKKSGFMRESQYKWTIGDEYPSFFRLNEGGVGRAAGEKKQLSFSLESEEILYKTQSTKKLCLSSQFLEFPIIYDDSVKGVIEVISFKEIKKEDINTFTDIIHYYALVLVMIRRKREIETLSSERNEMLKKVSVLEEYIVSIKDDNNELKEIKGVLNIQSSNNDNAENQKVTHFKPANQTKIGQERTNYLASISHELRTPLNSLLLLSQMLLDNEENNLTKDQMESIGVIYDSGNELLGLINDILDLSKIDAGKMGVNVDAVTVGRIAEDVKKIFRPLADNNKLNFEVVISDNAPSFLRTDQKKLMQILKNFIANALKFTKTGDVFLIIDKCDRNICNKQVEFTTFSVKDTGIGIPEDKLSIIFDAFCQADGSTSRQYGGTGLGLTIAKQTAQLLNGFIEVESEKKVGTVFKLFLPALKNTIND